MVTMYQATICSVSVALERRLSEANVLIMKIQMETSGNLNNNVT